MIPRTMPRTRERRTVLSLFVMLCEGLLFSLSVGLAFSPTASFRRPSFQRRLVETPLRMTKDNNNGNSRDADNFLPIRIAQQVQPSVVLVLPKGVRNMTARGSGFVLQKETATVLFDDDNDDDDDDKDNLYVITAAHVAVPGHSIQVTVPTTTTTTTSTTSTPRHGDEVASSFQRQYAATVVARNTTLDLALLRVNITNTGNENDAVFPAGLNLAPNVPLVGMPCFAHGYPASRLRGPAMTMGIVCGVADGLGLPDDVFTRNNNEPPLQRNNDDNNENSTTTATHEGSDDTTTFVVTDAALSGGMSGGPLVDATGTVIGVNALIRPDLRALGNYAVSSLEVLEFLQHQSRTQRANINKATKFKVWLYNDRMNKRAHVAKVLHQVAALDEDTANAVMMAAHTTGRGLVGSYTAQDQAQTIFESLRNQDLLVEMEA